MKKAFVIKSDRFGDSPDELGTRVMGSFLRQLSTQETKPDIIVFYGSGVKLVAEGTSSVLDALEALSAGGVELACCKKCIEYYGLGKKVYIGKIIGMDDVISILTKYDRVVTVA
jgi:intracellular sulfur oxidation DsrE/DsrF family protein